MGWQFTQAHTGEGSGGCIPPWERCAGAPCCPWGQAWQPQALEASAFPGLTWHRWNPGTLGWRQCKPSVGERSKLALQTAGCHPTTEPRDAWGVPVTFPKSAFCGKDCRTGGLYHPHKCFSYVVKIFDRIRFRRFSQLFTTGISLAEQELLIVEVLRCALNILMIIFYLRKYKLIKI